jgi:DNA-binding transcriptional regulator YdaS (Cro superfamily)
MTRGVDPAIRRLRDDRQLPVIAEQLKIARQAPYAWKKVPSLRVLDVEKITGIPRHELRPDLYPPPRRRARAAARNGCSQLARSVK